MVGFFTPDSRLHPQPGGFCKLLGEWHAISQPLGFPGRSMVRCLVFSSLTWQEGTPHDLPIFEEENKYIVGKLLDVTCTWRTFTTSSRHVYSTGKRGCGLQGNGCHADTEVSSLCRGIGATPMMRSPLTVALVPSHQ